MMQMQVSSEKDNDNENEVEQSFKWYRDFFKRGFDIFFSLIAIIILAIPMVDYRMKLATQLVVNKKRHSA